jgi:flagellar protein FliJ
MDHPLAHLFKHAENERDAALAACEQASRAERAATAQLEQLVNYRTDYEVRWGEQFSRGGEIALVRCYHEFMARLSTAVEQQQRAVDIASETKDLAQKLLRDRELRLASVGKLIDRRQRDVRMGVERREQNLFDEMSARIVRHTPTGMDFMTTR